MTRCTTLQGTESAQCSSSFSIPDSLPLELPRSGLKISRPSSISFKRSIACFCWLVVAIRCSSSRVDLRMTLDMTIDIPVASNILLTKYSVVRSMIIEEPTEEMTPLLLMALALHFQIVWWLQSAPSGCPWALSASVTLYSWSSWDLS